MDRRLVSTIATLAASFAVLLRGILAILPKDISEDLQDELEGYCRDSRAWLVWFSTKGLPDVFLALVCVQTLIAIIFALIVFAIYRWPARVGDKSDDEDADEDADVTVVPSVLVHEKERKQDEKKPPLHIDRVQSPRKLNSKKSIDKLKLKHSNLSRRSSRSYNEVLSEIAALTNDDKKGSSFSVPDDLDFDKNKDWSYDKIEPMSAVDFDRLEAVMSEEAKPQKDERLRVRQTHKVREVRTSPASRKNALVSPAQEITSLLILPPPLTFKPPTNETTQALRATEVNEYTCVANLAMHTPTPTKSSPRLPKFDIRAATLRYEEREGIASRTGQERRARLRKLAAEARAQRLADYAKRKGHEMRVVEADGELSKLDHEDVELATEEGSKKDDNAHNAANNVEEPSEVDKTITRVEHDVPDFVEDLDGSFEADEAIARIDSEAEIVGGWEVDDIIVEGAFFSGA